jgi:hypothetical protein
VFLQRLYVLFFIEHGTRSSREQVNPTTVADAGQP